MKHSFMNKKKDKILKEKSHLRLPKKIEDISKEKDSTIKLPKKINEIEKDSYIEQPSHMVQHSKFGLFSANYIF